MTTLFVSPTAGGAAPFTWAATPQTGSGTRVFLSMGENAVVEEGGQFASDDSWGVLGLQSHRVVLGAGSGIYSFAQDAGVLYAAIRTINSLDLVIGEGAAAEAVEDGVRADFRLEMVNLGRIRGGLEGVVVGREASIHNVGDIRGGGNGISLAIGGEVFNEGAVFGDAAAVKTNGALNLVNAGRLFGRIGVDAVSNAGDAPLDLVNTGEISGTLSAIHVDEISAAIVNEGLITVADSFRIAIQLSVSASNPDPISHEILNEGAILAGNDGFAIDGAFGVQTIENAGFISGGISLGAGDDVYRGRAGRIDGAVEGGSGEDTLVGGVEDNAFDGGDQNDVLRGRGGDDGLRGGGGADLVNGGAGDDVIRGGLGADRLLGKGGDDEIHGDEEIDRIFGGKGDDLLFGGAFSDQLFGGRGDDSLSGGGGFDLLHGGRGDDQLTGGAAADAFVLRRRSDDDVITDFENNADVVDLTAFGLRPAQFATVVAPALNDADGGATFLDLTQLGGAGSVLIEGLAFAQADASDFVL